MARKKTESQPEEERNVNDESILNKITTDFGRHDLNELRDKVNEIIKFIER